MRISVCVPTYNQERFISRTIDGILNQKNCDYNIIIANDCSTDSTAEIIENYKQRFPHIITVINQPENKGLIQNLKSCMDAAEGEYIAICEGDDYWCDESKLKKQLDIIANDKSISMVHTPWLDLNDSTGVITYTPFKSGDIFLSEKSYGKASVEEIMREDYRGIRFSSIVFRKECLTRAIEEGILRFSPKYTTMDIVLFYVMAYYGRIAFLPDYTTVYRIQTESVSFTSGVAKRIRYSLGCLHIYEDFIKRLCLSQETVNITLRRSFQTLYPYAMVSKDKFLAQELKRIAKNCKYKRRFGQRLCHLSSNSKIIRIITTIIFKTLRKA